MQQDNSPTGNQQEWQASDSKVSAVIMPSLTDAMTIATAGSIAYSNKDMEQENLNKTPNDTHVTLAQACGDVDDGDGKPTDEDDY